MEFLLINPGFNQNLQFPLGLAYLASYARKYGNHRPSVIDENSGQKIKDFKHLKPGLIGLTSSTPNFPEAKQAIKEAKEVFGEKIPIVIGGIHATSLPRLVLEQNPEIGIVIAGEGEKTFLELLNLLERKKSFTEEDLKKIKGIAFRSKSGRIIQTSSCLFIENLDEIPFPARDLFPMKEFYIQPRAVIRGLLKKTTQIMSSRGCPYDCKFCASKMMWKRRVRFFSAEYVVKEIERLVNDYGVTALYFVDDTLVVNKERLKKISSMLVEKGLNKKISWSCQMLANLVDEETLEAIKKAGCVQVGFGFESGCQRVLSDIKDGNVTVEQNARAIELCKKHGLRVLGNFVVGNPGETEVEVLETFEFMKKHKMDFVHPHLATPFPGSDYWELAVKRGIVDEKNIDWKKFQMSTAENNLLIADAIPIPRLLELYDEMSRFATENNRASLEVGSLKELLNLQTILRVLRTPSHILKYGPKVLKKMLKGKS